MTNTREDMIRHVRQIGESLIKNAESIVGSEEYFTDVHIHAEINRKYGPTVHVSREFIPEKYLEAERLYKRMNLQEEE